MYISVFAFFLAVVSGVIAKQDPAVEIFSNEFSKLVKSNNPKFLEIAMTPEKEFKEADRRVFKKFMIDRGASNAEAEEIANRNSNALGGKIDHYTPSSFASMLGTHTGRALNRLGKLSKDNASDLATKAAQDLHSVVSGKDISCCDVKFQALLEYYEKFFQRFGLKFLDYVMDFEIDGEYLFDKA